MVSSMNRPGIEPGKQPTPPTRSVLHCRSSPPAAPGRNDRPFSHGAVRTRDHLRKLTRTTPAGASYAAAPACFRHPISRQAMPVAGHSSCNGAELNRAPIRCRLAFGCNPTHVDGGHHSGVPCDGHNNSRLAPVTSRSGHRYRCRLGQSNHPDLARALACCTRGIRCAR